jgi:hypothetical protein
MAGELVFNAKIGESGLTLYCLLDQDDPGTADYGKRWNTSGSPAWDAVANLVTNVASHAVALAESPASSRRYGGDFPAGIAAGLHVIVQVMERAGAGPSLTADRRLAWRRCLTLGNGAIRWADEADIAAVAASVPAASTLAASLASIVSALPYGGATLASQADVQATRTSRFVATVPSVMERPDAGYVDVPLILETYGETGVNQDADALPTITAASYAGDNRSAALGAVSRLATGRYRVSYRVAVTDAIEGLVFVWSYVSAGQGITTSREAWVLDTTAPDFSAADRANLEAIAGKLPSSAYLLGGAAADGSGYSTLTPQDIPDPDLSALATAEQLAGFVSGLAASLAGIQVKANLIGSAQVAYTSSAADGGSYTIYAGDDCLSADGREIGLTLRDYAGPSLAGATAVMRLAESVIYDDGGDAVALEVPATVTVDGSTVRLAADLTRTQTAALKTYPPETIRGYVYQFHVTTEGGLKWTRGGGRITVKKRIGT